jgi:hypothetical protein
MRDVLACFTSYFAPGSYVAGMGAGQCAQEPSTSAHDAEAEAARLAVLDAWLWDTVLPTLVPFAANYGGSALAALCVERTAEAWSRWFDHLDYEAFDNADDEFGRDLYALGYRLLDWWPEAPRVDSQPNRVHAAHRVAGVVHAAARLHPERFVAFDIPAVVARARAAATPVPALYDCVTVKATPTELVLRFAQADGTLGCTLHARSAQPLPTLWYPGGQRTEQAPFEQLVYNAVHYRPNPE